jgi:hypothetical protein
MEEPMTRVSRVVFTLILSALLATTAATTPVWQETAADYQGAVPEQFMAKARITNVRPLGTGVTRPFRVTLELDGVTRTAVFKSIDVRKAGVTTFPDGTSDVDFQDSWQTEIAAYRVDRLIGLGLVPATIERRVEGSVGSLQWWVQSMMPEAERLEKKIVSPDADAWNRRMMRVRLFDQLIANVDRHLNNILVTAEFEPRLIDHSRAFRTNRVLRNPELLPRFSRSLLDGIRTLTRQNVREATGRYLTDGQIDRLLQRRDAILALAAKLVAERGEAEVLYD